MNSTLQDMPSPFQSHQWTFPSNQLPYRSQIDLWFGFSARAVLLRKVAVEIPFDGDGGWYSWGQTSQALNKGVRRRDNRGKRLTNLRRRPRRAGEAQKRSTAPAAASRKPPGIGVRKRGIPKPISVQAKMRRSHLGICMRRQNRFIAFTCRSQGYGFLRGASLFSVHKYNVKVW